MKYKSIMTNNEERCYICGSNQVAEWHHCLHGANKKLSEQYGLMIPVCRDCHYVIHHQDGKFDEAIKRQAQIDYLENKYGSIYDKDGDVKSELNKELIDIFGKCYL